MEYSDQRLKIKLLVGIVSVFTILIGVFYYILYQEEKSIFSSKINQKQILVNALMKQITADLNREMLIILENIVRNRSIVQALESNDRKKMLEYTFPIYKLLKDENSDYSIMHFHRADATSFLRLHNLQKYDDDLKTIRPMIDYTHANHIRTFGFEVGKYDRGLLTYRVAVPIFNKQTKYIGALELGIDAEVFVERLKNMILGKNIEGAFFVKKEILEILKRDDKEESFVLAHKTDGFINRKLYDSMNFRFLEVEENEQSYMIGKKDDFIKNFNGESMGIAVMQFNITDDYTRLYHFLRTIIILLFLLFLTILLQVYYGFNRFIDYIHQERLNVSVEKENLKNEQDKVQAILNAQTNILILSDGKNIKIVNQAFLDFFALIELEEFTKHSNCICSLFIEHDDFFSLSKIDKDKNWIAHLKKQQAENRRVTILDSENKGHAFELHIRQYQLESKLFVIEFHDITDMMIQQKKLYHEANTDKLTNIFNRNYFLAKIKTLSLLADEDNIDLSLIMFDIDHFKNVNDTYGHDIGDEVLKILSSVISKCLRNQDIFARWGGEEFLVLLPNINIETASKIAEKLRYALDTIDEKDIPHFTSSFGVVEFVNGESTDRFLKRVDEALYEAKDTGRNKVVTH